MIHRFGNSDAILPFLWQFHDSTFYVNKKCANYLSLSLCLMCVSCVCVCVMLPYLVHWQPISMQGEKQDARFVLQIKWYRIYIMMCRIMLRASLHDNLWILPVEYAVCVCVCVCDAHLSLLRPIFVAHSRVLFVFSFNVVIPSIVLANKRLLAKRNKASLIRI